MNDVSIGYNVSTPTVSFGGISVGADVFQGSYAGADPGATFRIGFGQGNGGRYNQTNGISRTGEDRLPIGGLQDALAHTVMARSESTRDQAFGRDGRHIERLGLFNDRPSLIEAVDAMGGWDAVHTFAPSSPVPDGQRHIGWAPFPGQINLPGGTMTVREYVQQFYAQFDAQYPQYSTFNEGYRENQALIRATVGDIPPVASERSVGGADRTAPRALEFTANAGLTETINLDDPAVDPATRIEYALAAPIANLRRFGADGNTVEAVPSNEARGAELLELIGELQPSQVGSVLQSINNTPELRDNAVILMGSVSDETIRGLSTTDNAEAEAALIRTRDQLRDAARDAGVRDRSAGGGFDLMRLLAGFFAYVMHPGNDPEDVAAREEMLRGWGFDSPAAPAPDPEREVGAPSPTAVAEADITARITVSDDGVRTATFEGLTAGSAEEQAAQDMFRAMSDGVIQGEDSATIERVLQRYPHLANMQAQLLPDGEVMALTAFSETAMREGEFTKVEGLFADASARVARPARTSEPLLGGLESGSEEPLVLTPADAEELLVMNSDNRLVQELARSINLQVDGVSDPVAALFTAYDRNEDRILDRDQLGRVATLVASTPTPNDDHALYNLLNQQGLELTGTGVDYDPTSGFTLAPGATPDVREKSTAVASVSF